MSGTPDLIELDPTVLTPGLVLPECVLDRHGRVLVPEDRELNARDIALMATRELFVKQAWFDAGGPGGPDDAHDASKDLPPELVKQSTDLIQALSSHFGLPDAKIDERRRYARYDFDVHLDVILDEQLGDTDRQRRLSVEAMDLSAGGFAFVFRQFINPGSTVYVSFEGVTGAPLMHAVVASCVLMKNQEHRVGCRFEVPSEDEQDAAA